MLLLVIALEAEVLLKQLIPELLLWMHAIEGVPDDDPSSPLPKTMLLVSIVSSTSSSMTCATTVRPSGQSSSSEPLMGSDGSHDGARDGLWQV